MRYSVISDDHDSELSTLTAGLNWYVNDFMQLKYNYIYALQPATDPNLVDNDVDLMLLRLQLTYW